jgi:hypothetical protein
MVQPSDIGAAEIGAAEAMPARGELPKGVLRHGPHYDDEL